MDIPRDPRGVSSSRSRLMVMRFMYNLANMFHMSLSTFLLGVVFLDNTQGQIPIFQPWNNDYFHAATALLLAWKYDDGNVVSFREGMIVTYGPVTDEQLCTMCEHILQQHAPTFKPAPGIVPQYWAAMKEACCAPELWLCNGQAPLYALVAGAEPRTRMRLFQLLWVMPLVPVSAGEQVRLAQQLLLGNNAMPPAHVEMLRNLPPHKVYPDMAAVFHAFPVLNRSIKK